MASARRLVIVGARPQPDNMYRKAVEAFTAATELSNQLKMRSGTDFRTAHHSVDEAICSALQDGEVTLASAPRRLLTRLPNQNYSNPTIADTVRMQQILTLLWPSFSGMCH